MNCKCSSPGLAKNQQETKRIYPLLYPFSPPLWIKIKQIRNLLFYVCMCARVHIYMCMFACAYALLGVFNSVFKGRESVTCLRLVWDI